MCHRYLFFGFAFLDDESVNRYHIKYMHIGDQKKEEIEKVVTSLHPLLRMRLRFLVHSLSTPSVESKQQLGPGSASIALVAPVEPMQT